MDKDNFPKLDNYHKSSSSEEYEKKERWGSPKKEGARELSSFEKYFGPLEQQSGTEQVMQGIIGKVLLSPVRWFHDNVLEKARIPESERSFYHRRYRRVPTIDECYFSDTACKFEANIQMQRDKMVEVDMIRILRQRAEDCKVYEGTGGDFFKDENDSKCRDLFIDYERAACNLYIKYGDMHFSASKAEDVLMKQKHRLIWERRHGALPTTGGFKLED